MAVYFVYGIITSDGDGVNIFDLSQSLPLSTSAPPSFSLHLFLSLSAPKKLRCSYLFQFPTVFKYECIYDVTQSYIHIVLLLYRLLCGKQVFVYTKIVSTPLWFYVSITPNGKFHVIYG